MYRGLGVIGKNLMNWQAVLAILAVVISTVAAWYARIATTEAKKGNELSRLNGLIGLRSHYMELAHGTAENIKVLTGESTRESAQIALKILNQKLHEVSYEIDGYHDALVHRGA